MHEALGIDTGGRAVIAYGRNGRLAVRVRDTESEERRRFPGIAAFPVDPAWRIEARLTPKVLAIVATVYCPDAYISWAT